MKAAFDLQEHQLVSGGSWVITPLFNHFEMSLGSAFINGGDGVAVSSLPNLASGQYDRLGVTAGYGYF